MPTFSAIALDRFIQPAGKGPAAAPPGEARNSRPAKDGKSSPAAISPAILYSTPKTPVPDSPTPFNPSPYVLNHKRRGPAVMRNGSDIVGFDPHATGREREGKEGIRRENGETEGGAVTVSDGRQFVEKTLSGEDSALITSPSFRETIVVSGQSSGCESGAGNSIRANDIRKSPSPGPQEEKESECDDFFEAEDWRSVASSSDTEDITMRSRRGSNYAALANRSEFFDALDDNQSTIYGFAGCVQGKTVNTKPGLSVCTPIIKQALPPQISEVRLDLSPEDVAQQASETNNPRQQDELDGLRSVLFIEIERRKRAEEALSIRQTQWQELAKKFSSVGLSFPSIGIDAASQAEPEAEADFIDQIGGQLAVARLVANAVARGSLRAELEQEMQGMIDGKNREIARLHDKLQYYELINHEMSQRNQEAIEIARRQRQRQKRRQRWMWTSFAVAVSIGATALVYSYFPQTDMKGRRLPFGVQIHSRGTAPESIET